MIKFKRLFKSSLRMKALTFYLAFVLAVIASIPSIGSAGTIPTQKSKDAKASPVYDREADTALIVGALSSDNGRIAMAKVGVTMQEMQVYVGNLNDAQLRLVAEKLRAEMPAGGDGLIWGLVGLAVLVLVIIVIWKIYKKPALASRY